MRRNEMLPMIFPSVGTHFYLGEIFTSDPIKCPPPFLERRSLLYNHPHLPFDF
jgi:hypothetical protein